MILGCIMVECMEGLEALGRDASPPWALLHRAQVYALAVAPQLLPTLHTWSEVSGKVLGGAGGSVGAAGAPLCWVLAYLASHHAYEPPVPQAAEACYALPACGLMQICSCRVCWHPREACPTSWPAPLAACRFRASPSLLPWARWLSARLRR